MSSLRTLHILFDLAARQYAAKKQGRLRGRHCVARLLRAQAKRKKAGKTVYVP